MQQQLGRGGSLNADYYRNWYDNSGHRQRRCARLPGGGGYPVYGLYDISPVKFGRVTNLVTRATHYGNVRYVSNFINVSLAVVIGLG